MIDIKKSLGLLVVFISSAFLFLGCSSGSGSSDNAGLLSIKAAVYDDNKTSTVLSDDRLYIYFDKSIDIDTIKDNFSNNFDIEGKGAFGGSFSVDYDDSMFYRLEITLVAEEFKVGSTTIALSKESALKELFIISHIPVTITSPKIVLPVGSGTYNTPVNGTVTDDVTGLIWQEDDDGSLREWNAAKTYCEEELQLNGLDWRLPTIDELISLTNKNVSSPAIDSITFGTTKSSQYWTESEYLATSDDDIWTVDFTDASTNNPDKSASHFVRCVSFEGTTNTSLYTRDDVNEVVLDTSTNMMWEDTPNTINEDNKKTWLQAKQQCVDSRLAGYDDWRLPNINELDSVTDKNTYNPAIDSEFQHKNSSYFWSLTESSDNSKAWYSYFKCGCNDIEDKAIKYQVRCVRSVD